MNDEGTMKKIIYVLGRQGSGKTTMCKILEKKYGAIHLGASDLLRKERDREGTPHFEVVNNSLTLGYLVPGALMTSLFAEEIKRHPDGSIFLLDGFPREIEQFRLFEENIGKSLGLIFFDCSPETSQVRITGRKKKDKRVDDERESLNTRLRIFNEMTNPLLESYGNTTGKQKITVLCDGPIEEVERLASEAFESLLKSEAT